MILVSLIIITFYIVYSIIKNKGVPHSLSSTYYQNGIWFSISLITSVLLLIIPALEITPENFRIIPFTFLGGLIFVGIAPDYSNDKFVDNVHMTAAIASVILSQLWVMLMSPWFLLCWIPCIFIKKEHLLFASEIIALITIYGILLL